MLHSSISLKLIHKVLSFFERKRFSSSKINLKRSPSSLLMSRSSSTNESGQICKCSTNLIWWSPNRKTWLIFIVRCGYLWLINDNQCVQFLLFKNMLHLYESLYLCHIINHMMINFPLNNICEWRFFLVGTLSLRFFHSFNDLDNDFVWWGFITMRHLYWQQLHKLLVPIPYNTSHHQQI